MPKQVTIKFTSGSITIDLLDGFVTEKWYDASFPNSSNYSPTLSENRIINHTEDFRNTNERMMKSLSGYNKEECCDFINKGIDIVNSSIDGSKFPYKATTNLKWEELNYIHRIFTFTGIKDSWFHNLDRERLLDFKTDQYINDISIFEQIEPDFKVTDRESFNKGRELINKWVHLYESLMTSERAMIDLKSLESQFGLNHTKYIDFYWDIFNEYGEKAPIKTTRMSAKEVKDNYIGYWHDFDVFLNISIKGKNYSNACYEYDNALEYDIVNLDFIDGGLSIYPDTRLPRAYDQGEFQLWRNNAEIPDWMLYPIPLGKVKYATHYLNELYKPTGFTNSLGNDVLGGKFGRIQKFEYI